MQADSRDPQTLTDSFLWHIWAVKGSFWCRLQLTVTYEEDRCAAENPAEIIMTVFPAAQTLDCHWDDICQMDHRSTHSLTHWGYILRYVSGFSHRSDGFCRKCIVYKCGCKRIWGRSGLMWNIQLWKKIQDSWWRRFIVFYKNTQKNVLFMAADAWQASPAENKAAIYFQYVVFFSEQK